MKKQLSILSAIVICCTLLFSASCKKNDDNKTTSPSTSNDFSPEIKAIISQTYIDSLRNKGMKIYDGNTPPNVEGIYLVSPYILLAAYGPEDGWQPGYVINDYKYRFYDQVKNELKIDYKQQGQSTDTGAGLGCFIAGKNNTFSIFCQLKGAEGSVSYTHVAIISGEMTATGIKNFQYGFILTEKQNDDENFVLIPVGKSRIWQDDDHFSEFATALKSALRNSSGSAKAGSASSVK